MTINTYAFDENVFDELKARIEGSSVSVVPEAFLTTVSSRVARGQHMQVVGTTAVVPVTGVLEKRPSLFSFFFGGATIYGDIVQAITDANARDGVERIVFEIDSPGGQVSGIQSVIDAMEASEKPITASVTDLAASAAYWIASQADEIIVNNIAAGVGSIGVVTQMRTSDSVVTLTSTNAPEKAPDASTEEGKKQIVAQLDEIHARFASDVADGRDTSVSDVNKNFGQGRVVLAEAALAAGMIDGIGSQETSPAASETAKGESVMDLETLKANHPDVFKAAKAEGVQEGVDAEKERVESLLVLGAESGDMDRAVKAINDGESLVGKGAQKLIAHFTMAGLKNKDIAARDEDNPGDLDTTQDDPESEKAAGMFDDHIDTASLKEGA